jgi:chromate reductase
MFQIKRGEFMKEIKLVGFTGSLRKGSYNMTTLVAIKELLPKGVTLEILDVSKIPFFNEDIEINPPKEVKYLKEKMSLADGVILATPEYNYSIPPVLKNALDWISRGEVTPLEGKNVALISASLSMLGGARVQYHLRQVLVALDANVLNYPEVFIAKAHEKFDENGKIIDEKTKEVIKELIDELLKKISNR